MSHDASRGSSKVFFDEMASLGSICPRIKERAQRVDRGNSEASPDHQVELEARTSYP